MEWRHGVCLSDPVEQRPGEGGNLGIRAGRRGQAERCLLAIPGNKAEHRLARWMAVDPERGQFTIADPACLRASKDFQLLFAQPTDHRPCGETAARLDFMVGQDGPRFALILTTVTIFLPRRMGVAKTSRAGFPGRDTHPPSCRPFTVAPKLGTGDKVGGRNNAA